MNSSPRADHATQFKPLILCEAANPEWTSVPLIGWSHARELSRITASHIVTQVRNHDAFVRAGLTTNDFTAIDTERVARRVRRAADTLRGGDNRGWTTIQAFLPAYYAYFEHLVWQHFAQRLRQGEFNLVHRITPVSPTTPSLIARRCARLDIPFVLGPLNGGLPWPRTFDRERRHEREWLSYIRGAHRLLPGYRGTRRHAAAIICGSLHTLEQMPPWCRDRCIYVPENAIDPDRFAHADRLIATRQPPPPLRVAFLGRLVPYKGADMLLHAAAPLIREGRVTVDIIGDGPLMPLLREIVRREGLNHGVQLPGWVRHQEVQERLGSAHLFAFPSIREFGGGAVLEAMALGVVPLVVNYGGPGELVTCDTGYRLPLASRGELVEAFRRSLDALADELAHPAGAAQFDELARRARQRVMTHFTWEARARHMLHIYRWVLGDAPKPRFDFFLDSDDEPDAPVSQSAFAAAT